MAPAGAMDRGRLHAFHLLPTPKHLARTGDLRPDAPFRDLGMGAFTRELDAAVSVGTAHMAVHSLKDSPAVPLPGLVLAACLPREDVRDVLIAIDAKGLGELVVFSRPQGRCRM